MAELIRMPRMSDTMTEGVIVAWHKKVGDRVKPGDLLAEVETDKATMELESYNEGTILYLGVEKGKSVQVDGILAVVGKEGESFKELLGSSEQLAVNSGQLAVDSTLKIVENATVAASLPEGAKEIRMPLLSDTMTEGKIISWSKKVGDFVKADDVLADVETDKATMEIVGYEEGTLLYVGVEAGKAAKINELIAIVGKAGTDVSAYVAADKSGANAVAPEKNVQPELVSSAAIAPIAVANDVQSSEATDQRIKASPLAKKLAADKGIDISKVNGSGDGGRVTKKDIDAYHAPAASSASATATPISIPAFTGTTEESYTDIPLTQMRKTIARRLGESMFSAPHFYLTMEITMDNCIQIRTQLNEMSPVKISFNDFIIKAVALSLRQHPTVNSSWMGEFIRQNHHINIGSAVATAEGLIVPVIRYADQKTLSQIALEAKELYGKAKDKKLQPVEFSGNTFTISNLGMLDIESFTAIINPPDSAILAVGRIKEIVVKKDTGFATRSVMLLNMSCDHRIVDGAVGAAFLQTLKKYLENPVTMLL
ncbi:MAG: pyruvate dehydrogenase complex dihydrolipoamide acetyltransferase [Chitinophagaceae bacterium]